LERRRHIREFSISRRLRFEALSVYGPHCSFPGCALDLPEVLDVCHIKAFSPAGPRHDSTLESLDTLDNLIILCASHHRLVDRDPETFGVDVLKRFRDGSASGGFQPSRPDAVIVAEQAVAASDPTEAESLSYAEAVAVWKEQRANPSEDFWQDLFESNTKLLCITIPKHILIIGSKCYLGGKSISNRGGKVVDFLYGHAETKNVVLIEIKQPQTRLVGSEYRSGVFAPSHELGGAIAQALTYRDELQKNYYALAQTSPASRLQVFDPQCMIVIGDRTSLSAAEARSFELFCATLHNVNIVTFDDVFDKIEYLLLGM
jgi:hypothetical protein